MKLCISCRLALLVAVLLAACGRAFPPPAPPDPLDGTTWQLKSIEGRRVGADMVVILAFSAGEVVGTGTCSQYAGSYRLQDNHLNFHNWVVETDACMVNQDEEKFLRALHALLVEADASYRVAPDQLELGDALGAPVLIFTRLKADKE